MAVVVMIVIAKCNVILNLCVCVLKEFNQCSKSEFGSFLGFVAIGIKCRS